MILYEQWAPTVGAEEDVVVIDLVRHLIGNVAGWNQHMNIFYDGLHVTDHDSEVSAEDIAERLYEEVLARRLTEVASSPMRCALFSDTVPGDAGGDGGGAAYPWPLGGLGTIDPNLPCDH